MTNGIDLNKIDLGSFGINEEDQQQNQLNANMTEAVKVNPDQHARVTQLSKQSGVPEFAVQSNPDEIEQKLKLDQIDLEGLQKRAPGTADFIGRDFNNAVIAQEDVVDGVMESIETIFSGLGESIKIGFKQQATGLILGGHETSSGKIDEIVPWSAMPIGMEMEAVRLSRKFAETLGVETDEEYAALKQQGSDILIEEIQKLEKRRQEITPKDMTIVEEGVRAGIESLANMVPATIAMVGTRGRAAPLMIIGAQTYTGSYADARSEGLPVDQARWFASIDAAIEVGTEMIPLGTLERMLTGQSKGLTKDAIQFAVREMGTEQLATALQSLNAFAFDLDEELKNAQTVEEMAEIQLRRQAVTAIATVVTGGLQASGVTVVNRTIEKLNGTERQQEVQGEVEQRSIDQLNAQAERSKLKERDVESFKQFIREADGENDTHVFIDSVQTSLYLQSKTRSEIEADPALKTLDNALRESRTTGADVSVPVADFTGDIAGTEHFAQLREHMTLSDQAVSPFRQEQHRQETQDYVRTLLNEENENVSEFVEAQEIYTSVRDQLIDTGAVNAQNASIMARVVPAWATAQARRTGRSVQQVYADAGLTIEGPQTGERARLEGEQVLAQARESGFEGESQAEAREWQDAVDKGLDMSAEARLKRAELMGFDTSSVMFHGTDDADFEAFDLGRFSENFGTFGEPAVYHVKQKEHAKIYGDEIIESYINRSNYKVLSIIDVEREIYESFSEGESIEDYFKSRSDQDSFEILDFDQWVGNEARFAKREGFDGVVVSFDGSFTDPDIGEIVLSFNPENIRSVNAAFDPDFKESANLLAQRTKTNGEPEARGYYDPANSIIRLTEAADLSTFLHEFAHFMYEMEVNNDTEMLQSINNWYKRNAEDVAAEANSYLGEEFDVVKQDGTKQSGGKVTGAEVVQYLDEGTTGVKAKDAAIRRAVHEQFARGFETYLMEGKSPSIELRNAFRAFARWLSQIYQRLRGNLDVNLDNEMRQVFDRLLATEEQIAAAEARARVEPFFTDAAMAGMTEEQFADYQKRQEKVKDVQSETLRDKLIKQLTRQTQTWWKEEKQDLIDEEMGKLRGEQVYATAARLKDGDIKLDHATVKEMIGEERTDKLGRKSIRIPDELRGMTAKGQAGVHPDEAAAFFGYGSGSEMLTDLVTAPKIETVAESNAERRMIDTHGDILTDGTIEQQADEAVQNEERGRLILHELKMVARGTNQRSIERETMKAIAAERIGQLSFREIHPGKYRKAEIRAAQEAARMLAEGNREGAAQAKQRQAVNYYMGLEATNAKNEITKIVDRMARYNKKKVREEIQKAEGGYWDQIVKILERFEFRKSATLTAVDQVNQDINTWAKERIEIDGDGLVLHNAVLNESYVTHWKNVAYSDLQGIDDSVKNIEYVARYANKLTRMGEEIEYNKLVEKLVTTAAETGTGRFKKSASTADDMSWIQRKGRWAMAQMTKIPYMMSWMDGMDRVGIWFTTFSQPMTDAYNAKLELLEEVGKPVVDMIQNRSKEDMKRHNTTFFIPEIKGTANGTHTGNLKGHEIIAVALNTGNEGNLKKMLLGEGWAKEDGNDINLQNARLQAVLKHMTESDWQMVQKIWDQIDMLYPQLAEVYRRTTGLVPPKVEATPVQTPFGTFKGGYYPVKYDPNRDNKAAEFEARKDAEVGSMFTSNASIQASVNTGSTNERTGYYAPIHLTLNVVPNHIQETIHYITHHDAVREVNRLLRDPRIKDAVTEKLGPEEFAQLKPWLNDIAKDGRNAPNKSIVDAMFNRLRLGTTLGVMGFKASTGIIQISGLSNTIAEVGMKPVMQSMRTILGSVDSMRSAWEFANEKSKVLKHRTKTMDRELMNAMQQLESKRGVFAAIQEASMKHIALIQTYMVDLPSWHAAYIKELSESGDEKKAFQYADWVIENVQGSGVTKDMAGLMRNQTKTHTIFTMFMTFFSALWNLQRDLVKGAKTGKYSTTTVAAKTMFLFTIPVLFEMMMRGEFAKEDQEPEELLQETLTKVALYPIASIPFVRDAANGLFSGYQYNASPVTSIVEQGLQGLKGGGKAVLTDDELTKSQAKSISKLLGAGLGVPGTGQAWASGEHLHEVLVEGEDFTLREFLFGPDR